ncbi:glycosyltransferase [Shewanella khirikhana]|uniref:glycosyltransferase family 2 protein n=1 Tax=Shewanella khirikhana TaxID=1965282 RepID=UPI0030D2CDA7
MQPLVSVYIPTCNRRELLERALNSVLAQTYPNVEIIISDDCSEDDTQVFCEKLVSQHDNIVYLRNDKRSGACVARNRAINIAKGEFITGLDDDDYFLPERIADLYNGLITNNYQIVFSDNKVLLNHGVLKVHKKKSKVCKSDLLVQNYIGNQVFTYKKNFTKINGFNEAIPAWQDLECWFRLLDVSDAYCIHSASYVVDVSHPHERITSGKIDKIFDSFDIICEINGFSFCQKVKLSAQLCSYTNRLGYKIRALLLNAALLNIKSIFYSFKSLFVTSR